MSFTWRPGPPEAPGPGVGPEFEDQATAEQWLGESWQQLLDDGTEEVALYEGDRLLYGPMSLHPAD